MNPFRYRGYYFDTETNLYYLQSRYYNPEWGRFLNADVYINANGGLIGYNMYAYCNNNPVMYMDISGTSLEDFWGNLKEFGKRCVQSAVTIGSIGLGVISIAAATGGTIMSGGAGAVAIPAAVAVAAKCFAVATVAGTALGITAMAVGETGETLGESQPRKDNPTKNNSPVWKSFDRVKGSSMRKSGTGKNVQYYEWDYTHNDIEVYDRYGRHLGSKDPMTGEMYKDAVPGRTIKVP